ncbi:hypothetical protein OGM63_19355 [Plectonema radiosum NIES-515]|uniref:Uncharacterized protein n=1 Tax=Plectonema radiosum NIES-515 TaxID=2986073 RepID=A0ABT3B2P0_9CYAN|nr:hypothetical protein [Plectonema radiosum]MCV3215643.1 hypothetical protein [Plectonema radiosum NIES-515]
MMFYTYDSTENRYIFIAIASIFMTIASTLVTTASIFMTIASTLVTTASIFMTTAYGLVAIASIFMTNDLRNRRKDVPLEHLLISFLNRFIVKVKY